MNYLRIQRFQRLIHWFHFDSVRDVLHVLALPKFAISQSEANSTFMISYDIKSLI